MPFDGIPFAALDFYDDLEADNSKAFWTAHKQIYEESVKAPLEALATELTSEFGTPKFFRPYRDVRFAKDKTPYKTHQGVYFGETHRYLHVSAAGLFVGGGYFEMAPDQLERFRRAVTDDIAGPELERRLALCIKGKLDIGGEQLTRLPHGYDKDHPRPELLRRKSLTLRRELGFPDWLKTRRARTEIVKAWRAMTPAVEWLELQVGRTNQTLGRGR
jgi:uncharacterized protein (TIGR02453 family)